MTWNIISICIEEQTTDGDIVALLAYFREKKKVDPTYFLWYADDKDGRLENLFWCDKKWYTDDRTFRNVLVFNTTNKYNAYNKPLIMFFCINHHIKAITFLCVLVVHEKKSSVIWVLKQLDEARNGPKPKIVGIDNDKTMTNAMKVIFW